MCSIRSRLRATDYYTNLDESSSPTPFKKERIKQLNATIESRGINLPFGFGIHSRNNVENTTTNSTNSGSKNSVISNTVSRVVSKSTNSIINKNAKISPTSASSAVSLSPSSKKSSKSSVFEFDARSVASLITSEAIPQESVATSSAVVAKAKRSNASASSVVVNLNHDCVANSCLVGEDAGKKSRKSSGEGSSSSNEASSGTYSQSTHERKKKSSRIDLSGSDGGAIVHRRHREHSGKNLADRHSSDGSSTTDKHGSGSESRHNSASTSSSSKSSSHSKNKISASTTSLGRDHRRTKFDNAANYGSRKLSPSTDELKTGITSTSRLPFSLSSMNLNSIRDSARKHISKSQVNLRVRNDNSPGEVTSKMGLDPYGSEYKHIRWQDLKDIIYEYDNDKTNNSNGKHVSRNKSFHSSRTTNGLSAIDNQRLLINANNKLKCQSVDNLNNIKNNALYINHIHREVVSSFINKNSINHVNSNLFTSSGVQNSSYSSRIHRRDRSSSKTRDDASSTKDRKSSNHRTRHHSNHGSTSDYASHSDSSSSSQSSTYSSGCYSGGYSSPISSVPSSPASSVGAQSSSIRVGGGCSSFPSSPNDYHSASCPILRYAAGSSGFSSTPTSPDFKSTFQGPTPKLLHISSGNNRWVIRRPDGLVVEIIPEHLWIKEQKKKSWKKALIDLFRDRYAVIGCDIFVSALCDFRFTFVVAVFEFFMLLFNLLFICNGILGIALSAIIACISKKNVTFS